MRESLLKYIMHRGNIITRDGIVFPKINSHLFKDIIEEQKYLIDLCKDCKNKESPCKKCLSKL